METFHAAIKSRNISLVTSAVVADTDHAEDSLKRLKQFGAKIIVGAFRASHAPYIFCQAYHQGVYGPSYVWLLTGAGMYDGWLDRHFSKDQAMWAPCSMAQVREASRGYLAVDDVYLRPDMDVLTVAGITAGEYAQRVAEFSRSSQYRQSRSAPYAFDAAWALALTLNRTDVKCLIVLLTCFFVCFHILYYVFDKT
ncbi:gamma-aminobutyric acid type B receptor subunit [Elysia marginata]|uniref:Gamma-aminobutyric acid type B receptor subunit n=1 Tax=Elysia marginata TaxID=1093978 RepID=A0AAV4J896_9GAST|nr:gamma-aminobutyric acid type B receptor subunit [Elysia marginata]